MKIILQFSFIGLFAGILYKKMWSALALPIHQTDDENIIYIDGVDNDSKTDRDKRQKEI